MVFDDVDLRNTHKSNNNVISKKQFDVFWCTQFQLVTDLLLINISYSNVQNNRVDYIWEGLLLAPEKTKVFRDELIFHSTTNLMQTHQWLSYMPSIGVWKEPNRPIHQYKCFLNTSGLHLTITKYVPSVNIMHWNSVFRCQMSKFIKMLRNVWNLFADISKTVDPM